MATLATPESTRDESSAIFYGFRKHSWRRRMSPADLYLFWRILSCLKLKLLQPSKRYVGSLTAALQYVRRAMPSARLKVMSLENLIVTFPAAIASRCVLNY